MGVAVYLFCVLGALACFLSGMGNLAVGLVRVIGGVYLSLWFAFECESFWRVDIIYSGGCFC